MSVRAENRWKARCLREAHERNDRARERDALRLQREPRSEPPKPSGPPSRNRVRRWLRLYAAECDNWTTAAQSCVADLDAPEAWLDEPEHWIWDEAIEAYNAATEAGR